MLIQVSEYIYVVPDGTTLKNNKIDRGNYLVQFNEDRGYYLKKTEDFKVPEVLYGNPQVGAEMVSKRFKDYRKNMGVLLSGLKGSGKTILAKLIAKEVNLPVLIIDSKLEGEGLSSFLDEIKQEVVIFIDEFEKLYDYEAQEQFLTIMDGVFTSKKLFVFTTNTKRLNEFLKNRPSRILYDFKFDKLEEDLIEEVIEDLLQNKDYKDELINIINILTFVSFDTLISLIEEINFSNHSPTMCVRRMNINVEHVDFNVWFTINGKQYNTTIYYNPLIVKYLSLDYKDEDGRYRYYQEEISKLEKDISGDLYEFIDSKGNKFKCTPAKPFSFNFDKN